MVQLLQILMEELVVRELAVTDSKILLMPLIFIVAVVVAVLELVILSVQMGFLVVMVVDL